MAENDNREYVGELRTHYSSFWHEARDSLAASMLEGKGGKVLEVGVGSGSLSIELAKQGYEVWGVDISDELLDIARENARKQQADLRLSRLDLSCETLPERFDHIILLDVLEHIEDDRKAVANLKKMLKPGGEIILTVPNMPSLYGEMDKRWGHYRRYTKKMLKALMSGFEIESLRNWNFAMVLPAYIAQRMLSGDAFMDQRSSLYGKALKRPWVNKLIARYYLCIENHLEFPAGMSILCKAKLT